MNRCLVQYLLLLPLLVPVGAARAAGSDPVTLTVEEAVHLALRHNRSVQSGYLQQLVERFDLRVARSRFRPDAVLGSGLSRNSSFNTSSALQEVDALSANAEVSLLVPTGGRFRFAWQGQESEGSGVTTGGAASAAVSFSQPLLRGGGLQVNRAPVAIAERSASAGLARLRSLLMDTVTSVVLAYRDFVRARRSLAIAELSVERSRELLRINRALVAAGRMAEMEVVQTEADVASKELALQSSRNAVESARLALLRVLDADIEGELIPAAELAAEPVNPDRERLLRIALANRPDLQQSELAVATAEDLLLLARDQRLWDLNLETRYGTEASAATAAEAQQVLSGNRAGYSVGLNLQIPLGDLERDRAVFASDTALRQARLALREQQDNVAIEVREAVRDVEVRFRQVELARRARELAERKLDIEQEKLKAGRSTNFQLVSFQNDLVNLQNADLNAVIDYLNALTRLDRVVGTTLETWGIVVEPAGTDCCD